MITYLMIPSTYKQHTLNLRPRLQVRRRRPNTNRCHEPIWRQCLSTSLDEGLGMSYLDTCGWRRWMLNILSDTTCIRRSHELDEYSWISSFKISHPLANIIIPFPSSSPRAWQSTCKMGESHRLIVWLTGKLSQPKHLFVRQSRTMNNRM